MSTIFRAGIDLDAPADVAWSVAMDWSRQGEWIPGTAVHVIAGDGCSVGSRLAAFTGVADLGFLDTMEITEWAPPRRCVVRHVGRLLRGVGVFEIRPRGPLASRFEWYEELQPPFGLLGRVVLPLVRPAFEAGLRRAGRTLDALCVAAARA